MPKKILVVGGGITGLEIGSIYTAFGCHVHLAEQHTRILPDIDEDLIEPLIKQFTVQFGQLLLQTKINKLTESESDITVELETSQGSELRRYDYVIVATGQNAHSADLGIENTAIKLDENGFIQTDEEQRTAESNIFAVGDVTGGNMLVHKAIGQGNVAAEVISGMPSAFDVRATPTIVYTTPQIAWCGLTEKKAQQQGVQITIEKVPWKHSSKAIITRSTEGMTKIISHKKDGRILGAGITGCNADELISEWVLAVEMGALAEDVALCLHGHPTLSEVGGNAADILFKRGKD